MVANITPTLCSIFHKPFPCIWIQIQTPISFSTNHSFLHCTVHSLQWKCTCEFFGHPHPGLNLWCVCYLVESITTTPEVPSQWLGTVGESEWQWNHLSWFYNYISIDSYLIYISSQYLWAWRPTIPSTIYEDESRGGQSQVAHIRVSVPQLSHRSIWVEIDQEDNDDIDDNDDNDDNNETINWRRLHLLISSFERSAAGARTSSLGNASFDSHTELSMMKKYKYKYYYKYKYLENAPFDSHSELSMMKISFSESKVSFSSQPSILPSLWEEKDILLGREEN